MKEKKKKLNLDELKVQSFVTAFDVSQLETNAIKGGEQEVEETYGCTLGQDTCQCPEPVPCDRI